MRQNVIKQVSRWHVDKQVQNQACGHIYTKVWYQVYSPIQIHVWKRAMWQIREQMKKDLRW